MNVRIVSVVILSIALLIYIGSFASIPQDVWGSMSTYQQAVIAFNLLAGIAVVLVGYWVYVDYDERARETANTLQHFYKSIRTAIGKTT